MLKLFEILISDSFIIYKYKILLNIIQICVEIIYNFLYSYQNFRHNI